MSNVLAPLNDLVVFTTIVAKNTSTGADAPVTSGTVTGFLAASPSPSATTIDASCSVSGVYVGGANGYDDGTWMFQIDAAVLTASLLNTNFATATPYFIVTRTNAVRRVIRLDYRPSFEATVE